MRTLTRQAIAPILGAASEQRDLLDLDSAMAIGLPKSIHPEVREMDDLRQKLDSQYNAYLNSGTVTAKAINKPPTKEDIDRMNYLARVAPARMNVISQSVYERNRNWVYFVMSRYIEQIKVFEETGYRHRLYTPEMLGKKALTALGESGQVRRGDGRLTPAQEAQRKINRKLHGVAEEGEIPDGVATGALAPMSASAPQQTPGGTAAGEARAPRPPAAPGAQAAPGQKMQRKVIIKRIIKKKADGTQEVIEQRTVVEVPVGDAPAKPAAPAGSPLPKPAPLPAPVSATNPSAPATKPAPQAPSPAKPAAPAKPALPAAKPAAPPPAAPPAAPQIARPAAPPKPAPARPVDKEIDDFFKKYNLK
ncbi:MAG: hypothetical protein U0166_04680 [Acidobacteriota bacterium]